MGLWVGQAGKLHKAAKAAFSLPDRAKCGDKSPGELGISPGSSYRRMAVVGQLSARRLSQPLAAALPCGNERAAAILPGGGSFLLLQPRAGSDFGPAPARGEAVIGRQTIACDST